MLPFDVIESLETMNVGGEPLTPEDAQRWSQLTTLINSYGPSECTSTSTIQVINCEQGFRGSIGKGAGCKTWIVDERRHLVPLGCVGELLLEWPLVGPGYVQSCDQTDSPFVHDLPWLSRGSNGISGRSGRLYRTGDLVCHDEAGNLLFKGRKDSQIKIAGQRVELGEIESCMSQHDRVDQAVCVFAETGPYSNRLVGFFTVPDQPGSAKHDGTRRLGTADIEDLPLLKEALRQHLTLHLPSHMIPAALCALSSLPRTSAGKLDTRSLMRILAESRKELLSNEPKHLSRKPGSEPERLIQKAIADVLGTSTRDVVLDRSFVANGGDSISAMRLAPRCREDDIQVTVAQILKSESIAVLADQAQVSVESGTEVAGQPMTDFSYACSPIQQFFFAEVDKNKLEPSVYNGYLQHFAVRLTCFCEPQAVSDALSALVADHAMLRARFRRESGNWVQYLPAADAKAEPLHKFMSSTVPDMAAAEYLATGLQYTLDIEHGPVFIAQLCDFPDGSQILIMLAHHLVVDLVSWRIIAGDLENRLTNATSPASGTSFMLWNEAQQDRAKSSIFSDAKTVLPTPAVKNELSFWGFNDGVTSNKNEDHEELDILIGRDITKLLLSSANAALSTSPVDLLQAAVWLAFFRIFPERDSFSMFTEAHGREPWNENIDLSRTVGWFTTMAPLTTERHDAETVHSVVRHVKDMRRRLPANGWQYFAARFFNEDGRLAFKSHNSTMEVEFNYMGQFQELESSDSLLQSINLDCADAQGEFPASSLIVILASVTKGEAAFSFSFNRALTRQAEIREWANQLVPTLTDICTTLADAKPQLTLSDLSNARLTYDELDHLQSSVLPDICRANQDCTVQDIVTCAPMVSGMLISQMRDPSLYNSTQTYRVSSKSGLPVRPNDLERAWQVVVDSQPSLRAVFVENTDPVASFHQIILKGVHATVVTAEKATETAARQWLQSERSLEGQSPLRPPHRLLLCKLANDPSLIICQFQMSHAITDGASVAILLEEWQRAYDKPDLERHLELIDTARAFAQLLDKMDKAHQLDYWKTKLNDSSPCHFPAVDAPHTTSSVTKTVYAGISETDYTRLEQFCRENDITLSSLFQSAWAQMLHQYTHSADVCFGYLRAGRDLPVPGIERSIGAYANLLTCRVDVSGHATLLQLARAVRRQMIEDLDFQYCSLAEIQHEIKCGHLFDSVFNYQQVGPSEDVKRGGDSAPSLVFEDIGGEDPNEYAVSAKITSIERTASVVVEYKTTFLSARSASELLSQFLATILAVRPE
ncbi:unnamed protein product [Cercospora beticola]|nr:unnamed protein product [Cercospora beticola]